MKNTTIIARPFDRIKSPITVMAVHMMTIQRFIQMSATMFLFMVFDFKLGTSKS